MAKRRGLNWMLAAALAWGAAAGTAGAAERAAERAFAGDGTLFRIYLMPLFIGRWMECGYGVAFENFATGSAHEAVYETGPLPDPVDEDYVLRLVLDNPEDSLGAGWTFEATVEDSAGTAVLVLPPTGPDDGRCTDEGRSHVHQKPSEWRKRLVARREYWFFLPLEEGKVVPNGAWFKAKPGERYRLRIRFSPGPGTADVQGHFEIAQPTYL